MSAATAVPQKINQEFLTQPNDVRNLPSYDRTLLIVSTVRIDGKDHVLSRYGDDIWWLQGMNTNINRARRQINFNRIPKEFREISKGITYRLMRRGTAFSRPPGPSTLIRNHSAMTSFFRYLSTLGISDLSQVTPLLCNSYVQHLREGHHAKGETPAKGASKAHIYKQLKGVEDLFYLSQYTDEPIAQHPWPDSSADLMSGYSQSRSDEASKTPLIPDEIFTSLFQNAWKLVEEAPTILDLRDEMDRLEASKAGLNSKYIAALKTKALKPNGFNSYKEFTARVIEIRIACFIVIASLSGCRIHELANLHSSSYYSTVDAEGNRFWWMKSRSTKTGEGHTEWLVPEAAVSALRVIDRWAVPYQLRLTNEIADRRLADPTDVSIALATEHIGAVFLAADRQKSNQVRTMSAGSINKELRRFAGGCGIKWSLASHQFRRKFANYAARSKFGDLRYLREHFKHWSMDMTLGYALNESQEMPLFLEIGDELDELKIQTVSSWLDKDEPLAGGYGQSIVNWRSRTENITLFKSHGAMIRSIALSTPIRSNGHAWCTAEDSQCVGNDLERTRCGDGCNNAVIGRRHLAIYSGLHDQLAELRDASDIGPGGRARVDRDVERCAEVLRQLSTEALEPQ